MEKPYRATGLSWYLTDDEVPANERQASVLAMIEALRAEVLEAGPGSERNVSRLGLVLGEESAEELQDRLWELAREFADRSPEPDGSASASSSRMHERALIAVGRRWCGAVAAVPCRHD